MNDLATYCVFLRHLVMPRKLVEAQTILGWAATKLNAGTYVNLMDQYGPVGYIGKYQQPRAQSTAEPNEMTEDVEIAISPGLRLDRRVGMLT